MAKERMINTKFWDDSYIVTLDPIEKLLYLYFLTNPLTNIAGIYEIQLRRVAFDTGIDKEMVLKILERFGREKKIFYVEGWIAVKNFIKNQKKNPSVQKGIQVAIESVPKNVRDSLPTDWDSQLHFNLNSNLNSNLKNTEQSSEVLPKKEWDYKNTIEEMQKDKNPVRRMLSFFWSIKGLKFENSKQLSLRYKRDYRPAKLLVDSGYSKEQIKRGFEYVQKKYGEIDWTLETVLKVIAEANK